MRILSQDGTIDLPYERFVISVNMLNQGEIIAWTGNHISDDECIAMAVYSSYAKAQKAMEMLRDKYTHIKRIECLIGSLASQISTLSAEDTKSLGDEVQELMCFKFPADEDVEE